MSVARGRPPRDESSSSTRWAPSSRPNSRRPASSSCGEPRTCFRTHGSSTRAYQLQRRRVRLCRAGEEGDRSDEGTRRRKPRLLGRPRRVPQPVQHRPAREFDHPRSSSRRLARTRSASGPVLDRAEAEEPTTHQYDSPAACMAFQDLRPRQGLQAQRRDEPHALAATRCPRTDIRVELRHARWIDANRGDELIGWDTISSRRTSIRPRR